MKTKYFQTIALSMLLSACILGVPIDALSGTTVVLFTSGAVNSENSEHFDLKGFGPTQTTPSHEDVPFEGSSVDDLELPQSSFRALDPWTGFPPMGVSSNGNGPVPPMASQKGVQYQWRWGK